MNDKASRDELLDTLTAELHDIVGYLKDLSKYLNEQRERRDAATRALSVLLQKRNQLEREATRIAYDEWCAKRDALLKAESGTP